MPYTMHTFTTSAIKVVLNSDSAKCKICPSFNENKAKHLLERNRIVLL
jgi:hypothetical protein